MTTDQRIARRKLSLLELAQDLGNVSKACKLVGYSRQQFYEIRRNYQTYGAAGLVDKVKGPRNPHPNRVAPEIEQAILALPIPCRIEEAARALVPVVPPHPLHDPLCPREPLVVAGGLVGIEHRGRDLDLVCEARRRARGSRARAAPVSRGHVAAPTRLPTPRPRAASPTPSSHSSSRIAYDPRTGPACGSAPRATSFAPKRGPGARRPPRVR